MISVPGADSDWGYGGAHQAGRRIILRTLIPYHLSQHEAHSPNKAKTSYFKSFGYVDVASDQKLLLSGALVEGPGSRGDTPPR